MRENDISFFSLVVYVSFMSFCNHGKVLLYGYCRGSEENSEVGLGTVTREL